MNWEWEGRTVLVTGATGSFGQHCLRRLLEMPVASIRALSRDEYKQAQAQPLLQKAYPDAANKLRWLLGDVRDKERLLRACAGVDVVIHAAALKRIDAGCNEPRELLLTNVLGTQNAVDAALDCGVQRFIFLSSDKGCAPINVYGASKAMAEHLVRRANIYGGGRTRLACTRYGNVLDSRGSVIELWRQARREGRPLPITHPDMSRFWLTLDQAVDCVLGAVAIMQGGELFIPSMQRGPLVRLAQALAPGWAQETVGIRPGGERLHEWIITADEARTAHQTRVRDSTMTIIYPETTEWDVGYGRVGDAVSAAIAMRGLVSSMPPQATVADFRQVLTKLLASGRRVELFLRSGAPEDGETTDPS